MAVPAASLAAGGPPSNNKGTGSIEGYMYDATVGGLLPVEGWVLILDLYHKNGEPYIVSTIYTPEPAHYKFDTVPVGEYTLRGAANNYEWVYAYNVTVQRAKTTWVDFELRRVGAVNGILFDATTHVRLPDSYCYFVEDYPTHTTYSDQWGQFSLTHVLPGDYTLVIEAPGHEQYIYPETITILPWVNIGLGYIYIP